jgi:hypothetical protein
MADSVAAGQPNHAAVLCALDPANGGGVDGTAMMDL